MDREMLFNPLFGDIKGAFCSDRFREQCCKKDVIQIIENSFRLALQQTGSETQGLSLRLKSSHMHERVFGHLREGFELSKYNNDDWGIVISRSGSERFYLTFGDYAFIVRKRGTNTNDTSITRLIDAQEGSRFFITICYDTDEMWTSLENLSFEYVENGHVVYSYMIDVTRTQHVPRVDVEVEKPAVTLKPAFKKKDASNNL